MRMLLAIGTLCLFLAACASTTQHDTVVGMIARCQLPFYGVLHDAYGDDCSGQYAQSVYVELTIRTAKGSTYTTDVPIGRPVQIGDTWPDARS